ncbi:MAG: hypothetical protein K9M55_01175 [Candidatus Marinimicrobia bacterium]|nr:hypothetical protein [Candidatus Neomarinimicrobiota bacterium]MCF7921288.1 hypothetical protein [Candidatus Neomarinimicrobiota bacterium]
MKIILRNIGLICLLISPLFSALLTEDLQVISPTGMPPLIEENYDSGSLTECSNCSISIRFMETSLGIILIREHVKDGVVQVSQAIGNPGKNLIIIKSSSGSNPAAGILKINVNLE